jgi:hypothetical protein
LHGSGEFVDGGIPRALEGHRLGGEGLAVDIGEEFAATRSQWLEEKTYPEAFNSGLADELPSTNK